jgi:hypothetical protein
MFPVRYELNSYILFRRNRVLKGLREEHKMEIFENWVLRRIFGQKSRRLEKTVVKSFITCSLRQV